MAINSGSNPVTFSVLEEFHLGAPESCLSIQNSLQEALLQTGMDESWQLQALRQGARQLQVSDFDDVSSVQIRHSRIGTMV